MSANTELLDVYAGPSALAELRQSGLHPDQVSAIFGASGAAKWLSIYGLDRVILGEWMAQSHHAVHLFGTSVGAFKLIAACHQNPQQALDTLAELYIAQSYSDGVSRESIAGEVDKLVEALIYPDAIEEILAHPRFRYSCGTALCRGMLGSEVLWVQNTGVARMAAASLRGRKSLKHHVNRVVFHDYRSEPPLAALDGIGTFSVPLTNNNLRQAVLASGSLPSYMHGVTNIEGAPEGTYRDGGLLDYHPVPGNFWSGDGLILYPHFYPYCKPGWFDKFWPGRKASAEDMNYVVLITPSAKFYEKTRLGRQPDRRDFAKFAGRDAERKALWQEVADTSHQLGEAFLELTKSGNIAEVARPIP